MQRSENKSKKGLPAPPRGSSEELQESLTHCIQTTFFKSEVEEGQ